mmetsp:Transcript_22469/g.34751  ORF Transcript_22469/g.34751 Transcript_22469/m.34751 type:complete len:95 (+) Transcript_22469:1266-1550(+)
MNADLPQEGKQANHPKKTGPARSPKKGKAAPDLKDLDKIEDHLLYLKQEHDLLDPRKPLDQQNRQPSNSQSRNHDEDPVDDETQMKYYKDMINP